MTETRLCEACGAGPVDGTFRGKRWSSTLDERDINGAPLCRECNQVRGAGTVAQMIRANRAGRAQPKAELEALDFVATRDLTLQRRDAKWDGAILIRTGRALRFSPDGKGFWSVRHDLDGSRCCTVAPDDVPRIHAELLGIRDGHSNATPPAPSAVEPKPNPLRGLTELKPSFPFPCDTCPAMLTRAQAVTGSDSKPNHVQCHYCYSRHSIKRKAAEETPSAVAAVQPAAVEEVRHPADWCVDDGAPPGLA